ncbi:hypothetical protein FKP32DRAFT_1595990 [Trametes sanguinea]|nr:hypothetical protein FKP32DRAFT_1595990 [Trametes sanguinea]
MQARVARGHPFNALTASVSPASAPSWTCRSAAGPRGASRVTAPPSRVAAAAAAPNRDPSVRLCTMIRTSLLAIASSTTACASSFGPKQNRTTQAMTVPNDMVTWLVDGHFHAHEQRVEAASHAFLSKGSIGCSERVGLYMLDCCRQLHRAQKG